MHLIAVIDAARSAELEKGLRACGLSVAKLRVLGVLALTDATSMTDLTRGTFYDRTTLTRVADQLIEQGCVERCSVPGDRRKVLLKLTPAGAAKRAEGDRLIEDVNAHVADVLDPDTTRATNRALLRLVEAFIPGESLRNTLTGRPSKT